MKKLVMYVDGDNMVDVFVVGGAVLICVIIVFWLFLMYDAFVRDNKLPDCEQYDEVREMMIYDGDKGYLYVLFDKLWNRFIRTYNAIKYFSNDYTELCDVVERYKQYAEMLLKASKNDVFRIADKLGMDSNFYLLYYREEGEKHDNK